MSRKPLIAGNWKMHKTSGEAAILVQDIAPLVSDIVGEVDVAVIPPFTALKAVSTVIELDRLDMLLGAQDVHWESEGAFTGAVSPRMLAELRVDLVVVGHSERRGIFGDTDEVVAEKLRAVLDADMDPVLCVGESLGVRDDGETESFVRGQVRAALDGLEAGRASRVIVAYEPIWAIGSGRTPSPESANDVARSIRATMGALFGAEISRGVRVLYGGSVKPENAPMFMAEPDIDGALVGGAALEARSFADIAHAAR